MKKIQVVRLAAFALWEASSWSFSSSSCLPGRAYVLLWRATGQKHQDSLTSLISGWGNGGSPNSDSCSYPESCLVIFFLPTTSLG